MHRAGKKQAHTSASSRHAAAGYAKRKSAKLKKPQLQGSADDVYEYEPGKTRRAKVRLQLEKDELRDAGSGDSGSEDQPEDSSRKRFQPRLVGDADDEDGVAEDEDEEIDSDEAFGESDEERFAGSNFPRPKVSDGFDSESGALSSLA